MPGDGTAILHMDTEFAKPLFIKENPMNLLKVIGCQRKCQQTKGKKECQATVKTLPSTKNT